MRERTSNKALPKQNQLRRSAEAKENMGNKKSRPSKKYSNPGRYHTNTFWEKLILNWHNYSLPQKIAVITAGLVLSGVAVYLAVGLAQSVYANMSAELDTPSRTREPSVFTRIDRALSFPVASAARTPERSKVFELFPEFLDGSDDHEKDVKKEMEKGFHAIDDALYDFIQTPSEKSKVVAVLENHYESLIAKNLILAYLKRVQLSRPSTLSSVTVIHEMGGATPDVFTNIEELYKDYKNTHGMQTLTRNALTKAFTTNCFVYNPQKDPLERKAACFFEAIAAYDFTLIIAPAIVPEFFEKNGFAITFSDFPHVERDRRNSEKMFRTVDTTMITYLQNALAYTHSNDIVIVVTGAQHGKAVAQALKKSNHPFRLLHLHDKEFHPILGYLTAKALSLGCIKPIENCSAETQKKAKEKNTKIEYCAESNDYDPANCDEELHQQFSMTAERDDFLLTDGIHPVPPILPRKHPDKLTYFFAPKSSIKMLEAKLEKDKQTVEKQNNQRMEL